MEFKDWIIIETEDTYNARINEVFIDDIPVIITTPSTVFQYKANRYFKIIMKEGVVPYFNAQPCNVEFLFRKVRRHNRQIHKSKPSKGGKRKRNQSPYIVNGFKRFDKVRYNKIECFITGKRSSGYFQLKKFDGTIISQGVSSKKLKLLEHVKGWIVDWRIGNSSPT